MININIFIWPIVGIIFLFIFSTLKLKKWNHFRKVNFIFLILGYIFIIAFFILNYYSTSMLYTEGRLEVPNGLVAEVVLYDLKVLIVFMIFNIIYLLTSNIKK